VLNNNQTDISQAAHHGFSTKKSDRSDMTTSSSVEYGIYRIYIWFCVAKQPEREAPEESGTPVP